MTVIRLLLPLTILRWPLAGGIIAIAADILDWHVVSLRTDSDYAFYQRWDKVLDFYYLSLEAWVVFHWKSLLARRVSMFFFFYRFVGVVLFEIFQVRSILFIFPNIFEGLYLFYLSYSSLLKKNIIPPDIQSALKIALWVIIPGKLLMEYILHIAPVSLIIGMQQFGITLLMSMTSDNVLRWLSIGSVLLLFHYKRRVIVGWIKNSIAQVDKSYHSMVK